jgi:hypothetical protein
MMTRNGSCLHRLSIPLVLSAAFAIGPALAVAADAAPSTQLVNPSKAEPMMIEPSPAAESAAYQRDIAECASHSPEGRQVCREMVNEQYGIESEESSDRIARCDALDGAARADCLNGASAGTGSVKPVRGRAPKNEAGHRPGSVA